MGLYDGALGGDGFASTAHVAAADAHPGRAGRRHLARRRARSAPSCTAWRPATPRCAIAGVDPEQGRLGPARRRGRRRGRVDRRAGARRAAAATTASRRRRGTSGWSRPPSAPTRSRAARPAGRPDRRARRPRTRVLDAAPATAPDLDARPWDPARRSLPARERRRATPRPTTRPSSRSPAAGRSRSATPRPSELLAAAGCRGRAFDPLTDPALPDGTAGIYLGGGFPEVHAAALGGEREPARRRCATAIARGMPTVAECAGLLYLCRDASTAPRWSARSRPTPR